MSSRFVILHHTGHGGEHWDLMLERGDVLLTWQLLREPSGPQALPIPAHRIGDHRKAYLTYEGPISGDRGHVTRYDEGDAAIETLSDTRLVVVLNGLRLTGRFSLTALAPPPASADPGEWQLESVRSSG